MTKLFLVEDTGIKVFSDSYWCKTCNNVTYRIELGRGLSRADLTITEKTPDSVQCPKCGNTAEFFTDASSPVWKRTDTGEEIVNLRDHPGAAYYDPKGAWDRRSRTHRFGPDGKALVIVCPDGWFWYVDSRCSNCTKPDDNSHRCWIRTGSVEDGTLSVHKSGDTCSAGAGSIDTGTYHGFVRDSKFEKC
jgi:hypothetical protein